MLLHYAETGEGEPLVLVHGSWNDHRPWQPAVDAGLEWAFRVMAYDRRGHGRSGLVPGPGTRPQDEDDLAALIEALGLAPAHAAGNSFGASITAGLAARRPELFGRIVLHEPPLAGLVLDDAVAVAEMRTVTEAIEEAKQLLREGDDAAGAKLFVEEIAPGPGAWGTMPEPLRDTIVTHAQTWLDEQQDPGWALLDLDGLGACTAPVLLSRGSESPAWFGAVLDRLAAVLPHARRNTFQGAGHIPHVTHPQDHAAVVTAFMRGT
ncbi:alpha/beta fold hydrolase [Kitasatospora sp. DSM 101779]|uniref:alpha/beta fold hydrolase n=1 Tax=Kitasatospora sp. DSM 101779 TaxID=2853165 RepID=UPI0021DA1A0E|nr:alpha/beta hydrolase [Kitasatospora sp. DSM 101779]MCU7820341.1 alpha/beta hydrolase [Kitasatospora sp. DSM 101779]